VVAWCASWCSHRPRAGLRPWHVGRVVTDLLAERILRTREEAGPVDPPERADEVLATSGAGEAAYEALAECGGAGRMRERRRPRRTERGELERARRRRVPAGSAGRRSARCTSRARSSTVSQPLGVVLIGGQHRIHAAQPCRCVDTRPSVWQRVHRIGVGSCPDQLDSASRRRHISRRFQGRASPPRSASGQTRLLGSDCPSRLPSPPDLRHFEGSSGGRPHVRPSVTPVRLTGIRVKGQAV
jgi:hypothetical protein